MNDCMHFPDTVEEFMEQYKMTDTKQVYSNGIEYVPIFRMKQWFEYEKAQLFKEGTTSYLISRTETVERLRGVLDVTVPITDYDGGYVDGVEVGISTVSTMPTIQPVATDTSVGGTISRQRALDALAKFVPYAICDESTESYTNGLTDAYNLILQMPSAQPDKSMIEDCLYHIRRNTSVHTSAEGVVAIKHYMGEIWRELFGEEDMPKWMT